LANLHHPCDLYWLRALQLAREGARITGNVMMSEKTRSISIEQLLEAAKSINPETPGFVDLVQGFVERGYTVAESLIEIGNQQRTLRKPPSADNESGDNSSSAVA
jgi:hypothetical protein